MVDNCYYQYHDVALFRATVERLCRSVFPPDSGRRVCSAADVPPLSYDDGSKWVEAPEKLLAKIDEHFHVLEVASVLGGLAVYRSAGRHRDPDAAAQEVRRLNEESRTKTGPKRLWLATFFDAEDSRRKSGDETFDSVAAFIAYTRQLIVPAAEHPRAGEFTRVCGTGYDENFTPDDGLVAPGYGVQILGGKTIQLFMVHIYYGK